MDDFAKYFTLSDNYLCLGAEKIYIQFFIDEIGHLDRKSQILDLFSKLTEPDTNFPFLCSIFYLLMDHEVRSATAPGGDKSIKITIDSSLISSTQSLVIAEHALQFLMIELPKSEEMIHFRIKIVLDLVYCLFVGHFEDIKYQLPMYPGLMPALINMCLKAIKFSQDRPDIDLRRISALFLLLLKIKFRDRIQEISTDDHFLTDAEKKVWFDKMKSLCETEVNQEGRKLVTSAHCPLIEEWYQSLVVDPVSPLPTIIVVGYLRALLNMVTTTRPKQTNTTGFDCTSELETNFNYMIIYLRDLSITAELYKSKVQGKKSLNIQKYIYYTLALDKFDSLPEVSSSFAELKIVDCYKELYLKEKDILPDCLAKELETAQGAETKNEELIRTLSGITAEVYTHRISSIYYILRTFAMIHKLLKSNNYFQAMSLGNYIFEAKGILVMLKIISEKILQTTSELQIELVTLQRPTSGTERGFSEQPIHPIEAIVEDILYLFYEILYDYPENVTTCLNDFKAYHPLKKYAKLYANNPLIKKLSYLLIKKQLALMPKKVRENKTNMAIVTFNYNGLEEGEGSSRRACFLNESIDQSVRDNSVNSSFSFMTKPSNDLQHYQTIISSATLPMTAELTAFQPTQEAVKKYTTWINATYLKYKDNLDDYNHELSKPQESSKYKRESVASLYNKLYAKVEIPENFDKFYSQWLNEEVFNLLP